MEQRDSSRDGFKMIVMTGEEIMIPWTMGNDLSDESFARILHHKKTTTGF